MNDAMNELPRVARFASLTHVEERKRLRAVWMLLLATVCWGMSFPLMKGLVLLQQRLLPGASVWFITAQTSTVRFGLAAIVLALIFAPRMQGFTRLDLKLGVGLGFFAGTGTLFQMAALSQTLASTSAFLTQFYVLLLPLWVVLWQRRRPSLLLCSCCALVIVGMGVLCGLRWNDWRLGRGEWLTLLAAVLFTGNILWLDDREFASADKLRATVVMFTSMAVILLPVAAWQAPGQVGWWRIYLSPGMSVMLLVLLGASTLVAYTLMNVWQPHLQPTQAGLIYCAEPVFASLYALFAPAFLARLGTFAYANESVTWNLFVGGVLITLANVLVQYDR
jgi:drug/metabolite transporter (DMT)-like permease